MDISRFDTTGTVDFKPVHPVTGEGIDDIVLTIVSVESRPKATHTQLDIMNTPTAQMNRRAASECLVGWSGIELDGKVLECSEDNRVKLFDTCPWVVNQICAKARDLSNFLPKDEEN